jgi:hypothetical protein
MQSFGVQAAERLLDIGLPHLEWGGDEVFQYRAARPVKARQDLVGFPQQLHPSLDIRRLREDPFDADSLESLRFDGTAVGDVDEAHRGETLHEPAGGPAPREEPQRFHPLNRHESFPETP